MVQLAGGVKVVVKGPIFVMVAPHYAFKRAALSLNASQIQYLIEISIIGMGYEGWRVDR